MARRTKLDIKSQRDLDESWLGNPMTLELVKSQVGDSDLVKVRRSQFVRSAINIFSRKGYHSTTIKEIAQYLEVTEEQVIEALEGNNVFYPKSLSMEFDNNSDGQETTLMDLIGEEDEQIDNIANVEDLRQRLATLNPVERMIIEERYYKGKTQKEVAAIIGKSQMTVSRLEKKVMEKLRSDK